MLVNVKNIGKIVTVFFTCQRGHATSWEISLVVESAAADRAETQRTQPLSGPRVSAELYK